MRWLLNNAAVHPELTPTFLSQVSTLYVVDACGCGCPSVDFAFRDQLIRAIVADAEGVSPEGEQVGVILWASEAVLSGLEVYSFSGVESFGLPPLDTLVSNGPSAS